jgi:hypothetical protein
MRRISAAVPVAIIVAFISGASWGPQAMGQPAGAQGSIVNRRPQPAGPACDPSLWTHVYAGDPRKFSAPEDRLQVIQECVTVTGVIESARPEKDGDWHLRLKLDAQFSGMINDRNISGQREDLVLEPVCENPVTQRDTLKEGVCEGFHQDLFQQAMIGQHVQVTGAYVTDMEHGWNEIHPVTSIMPVR